MYSLDEVKAVEIVLSELNAKDKPTILVLNKIDKASEENIAKIKEVAQEENIIEISAKEKINLDGLLKMIEENLPYEMKNVKVLVPYEKGDVVSMLHKYGKIIEEEYRENGTYMEASVDEEGYNRAASYIISD